MPEVLRAILRSFRVTSLEKRGFWEDVKILDIGRWFYMVLYQLQLMMILILLILILMVTILVVMVLICDVAVNFPGSFHQKPEPQRILALQ